MAVTSISKTYNDATTSIDNLANGGTPEDVAGLVTEFYELFVQMGYLDASLVIYPPHTNSAINTTLAQSLGISEKAIRMMEMLPYIDEPREGEKRVKWNHGGSSGEAEFLLGGQFVDYRADWALKELEGPFFAVERDAGIIRGFGEWGGKYMEPDYICLSWVNEESAAMILNTRNYKIWTLEFMENRDPSTQHIKLGEDGDNYLALDRYPSRHATTVLREYMNKFKTLEWIPGGLQSGTYEGDSYARLYVENGWPDNFDLETFEDARVQWEIDVEKRWENEDVFAQVIHREWDIKRAKYMIDECHKKLAEVDKGEAMEGQGDLAEYRKVVEDELKVGIEMLKESKEELLVAKDNLNDVDTMVRKMREERIEKYGF